VLVSLSPLEGMAFLVYSLYNMIRLKMILHEIIGRNSFTRIVLSTYGINAFRVLLIGFGS